MFAILKIIGGVLGILALSGGLFINSQQAELLNWITTKASKSLGVPIKVGGADLDKIHIFGRDKDSDITLYDIEISYDTPIKIGSVNLVKNLWELDKNSDIKINDVEIFDKNSKLIGKIDTADVNLKLLALRDNPLAALDDISIQNIKIFDKNSELIAKVDKTDINFKSLTLDDDPLAILDEIKIDGALLNVKKREDDKWNFDDLTELKGKSKGAEEELSFNFKVLLEHGTVNADFDGKNISVEEISTNVDCVDMNAIINNLSAKTLGSQIKASGTVGKDQQVVNAEVDDIFFDKILPYLPEDILPEGLEILNGTAKNTTLHLLRNGETLSYLGSTKVNGAAVKFNDIDFNDLNGNVTFNEREIVLDAAAVANGQQLAASGKVHLNTDETFLDLYAESDSLAPSALVSDLGLDGAANIRAHIVGTTANPQIDAKVYSDWIAYEDYSAQNISTKLRYVDNMLYLNDASANIFGGNVTGIVELKTDDFTFNANVKANGIDAATLCNIAGAEKTVGGKISGDIGINGGGDTSTKIYGNATVTGIDFEGLLVNEANASFHFAEDNLTIDYLSAKLPNNGTLGLEGKITDMSNLDLNFYGAHVDMAIVKNFEPMLDMGGLADFKGTVKGDAANPNVNLVLSAIDNSEHEGEHFKGQLFKQPFDSIKLMASGSIDGIHIDDFNLEKDGNIKWKVIEGTVGLTGDKNINIQLDTTAVRAEDLAALVAPDQPITGNVSNTVKITGTIDNPNVTGKLKFNRGSYRGFLLSGMEGDYFLEGDILRLQNFEITSPMVDMTLNGTIDKNTRVMDFVVLGNDINLQRFKGKLPDKYNAEGHVKFEGLIQGTPDMPIFIGELTADEIFLNGVSLTNVYGHVDTKGSNVYLDDFHFRDGDGNYQMQISANLDTEMINGEVEVINADIPNLCTIADQNNKLVTGKLNSKILVGGTFDRLTGSLDGEITQGTFAGYDIHDIKVAVSLVNNIVNIRQLEGKQGDKGTINLIGSVNLAGALDVTLTAKEIALGIFSKAAGFDIEMLGTSNINAEIKGALDNPTGKINLTARGGIKGATFDLLEGNFKLENRRVNVDKLTAEREISGKKYSANVKGFVPLKALFAHSKENLPDNEQLNLDVSLDNANLSLLPVMSKYVKFGTGDLEGAVKITGTAARPQFNGQISMNDGSIGIKHMKSIIEHVNISMLFKGERFDIEDFSGNIGGGNFSLTGGLSFPHLELVDYNFDFKADNLDIDSDFYKGPLNVKDFNISEGKFFRKTLPKISGQIDLDKCRISVPSLPEDDEEPLPEIILDVALNLGEKVHFYSSRLYDIYLVGNARFEGTTQFPKTSGTISVKRGGTLTYLESVFNIREGEVHFNQIGSFLPTLHLFADTQVANTKVFLVADGQPNNMKFLLTSSPEMTQEEIIKLLTLRDNYSKGGENNLSAEDALTIGLQVVLLGDIEDALKRTIGIDQFSFSRGSGSMFEKHTPAEQDTKDKSDYNIKIGKYVNDKLMLRYTHGFGNHKVDRYGIQYDFNDNLGLTIEREGGDYVFSLEARYKF